jgi:hypothetical protein
MNANNQKLYVTIAAVISLAVHAADLGAAEFSVLPRTTDPAIDDFNEEHVYFGPQTAPRNQLFVFLPGTGGRPMKHGPLAFAKYASRCGYHAVGLMYPDAVSAQSLRDDEDIAANLKFRLAIIRADHDSPHIRVIRANSIENRLIKLLLYLERKHPREGWGQYLGPGGEIVWNKVAVAGHSQGGGHAAIIAKFHTVARVIMLGSPKDFSYRHNAPAKGFDKDNHTPPGRYFAFNHRQDAQGCTPAEQMRIFRAMGLSQLGVAEVDQAKPPYGQSHVLFTNCPIRERREAHGTVLRVNPATGEAHFAPVWVYMLTAPVK